MARKSIDFSQSLLKFQDDIIKTTSKEKSKKKHKHEVNLEKSEFESVKNEKQEENNVELIKTKYFMQNKALAKSNSLMLSKITDMEVKIGRLINENISLRKEKLLKAAEMKKMLEEKISLIEATMFQKFDDFFQFFKNLRKTENLNNNHKLELLSNFNRPVTSTPIRDNIVSFSHNFDFNTKDKMNFENEKLENFTVKTDENDNNSDKNFNPFNYYLNSKDNSLNNQNFSDYYDETNSKANQVFIEDNDSDEIKISCFTKKNDDEILGSFSKSFDTYKSQFQNEEILEEQVNIDNKNEKTFDFESNAILADTNTTKHGDDNDSLKKNDCCLNTTENHEKTHSFEKYDDKESKDNIMNFSSRPRRHRKLIDYKPISLRAKMRRESVALLNAVGENVLINYAIEKNCENEFQSKMNTKKRKKTKHFKNSKNYQVKPLNDVTNIHDVNCIIKKKVFSHDNKLSSNVKENFTEVN